MTLVVPQPAKGQFIDVAAIVAAIGAINTAITNVIGAGLRDISGALGVVNGVLNAIQNFFQNTIYPPDAINRARGVKVCFVTLHVGLGTFAPVKTETIERHTMHEEGRWMSRHWS